MVLFTRETGRGGQRHQPGYLGAWASSSLATSVFKPNVQGGPNQPWDEM